MTKDLSRNILSIEYNLLNLQTIGAIGGTITNNVMELQMEKNTYYAFGGLMSDQPKEFELAKEFINHNEKVYEYKGKYYSFDNYKHKGGSWKVMVKRGGNLSKTIRKDA